MHFSYDSLILLHVALKGLPRVFLLHIHLCLSFFFPVINNNQYLACRHTCALLEYKHTFANCSISWISFITSTCVRSNGIVNNYCNLLTYYYTFTKCSVSCKSFITCTFVWSKGIVTCGIEVTSLGLQRTFIFV